ncbi:hypothetical protein [Salipaludibacillus sp. LMS25]|nr:hypothetical protein [Salipaludibacillus sp. LMS25]
MQQVVSYLPDWPVYMQAFILFFVPFVMRKLFSQVLALEDES